MADAVADFFRRRLAEWGGRTIFGYPGDGINDLAFVYVDDPARMGAAWDEALASPVPVVLEVETDPEVPPLPPFFTFEQVKNDKSMPSKGDPKERHLLVDTARQVPSSVLPGSKS